MMVCQVLQNTEQHQKKNSKPYERNRLDEKKCIFADSKHILIEKQIKGIRVSTAMRDLPFTMHISSIVKHKFTLC